MRDPFDPLAADTASTSWPTPTNPLLQTLTWVIENSLQATVVLDLAAPGVPVVLANTAFVKLAGAVTDDAVLGCPLPDLLGIDGAGEDWSRLVDRLACGLPTQLDCRAHRLTHDSFRARITCHVMTTPGADLAVATKAAGRNSGPGTLAMAVVVDRSAEWLASQQRITESRRLDALLAGIDDALVQVDSAMVLNRINPAAEILTGWSENAAKGLPVGDVVRLGDRLSGEPIGSPLLATLLSGQDSSWVSNAALCRADGSRIPVAYRTAVVRDADGMPVEALLLMRNHSDASVLAEAIAHSAWHDALTGLPNRSVFEDRLAQAVALAERHRHLYGVLLVDVDGVDSLIEAQGHASGQDLLKAVADSLRKAFRRCDTVCRIGDFRFAVVLPVLNTLASETLLETKALRAQSTLTPLVGDGLHLSLRVAAAISQGKAEGNHAATQPAENLFQRAETRLTAQGMSRPPPTPGS